MAKSVRSNLEKAGEEIVTVDRRRAGRRVGEAAESQVRAMVAEEKKRTKTQRRRQIDPTTCERDYSQDEVEFMQAMDAYKRKNGRMFPTCSEILEVIRDLGYSRPDRKVSAEVVLDAIAGAVEEVL